jgi:hypothetical protein
MLKQNKQGSALSKAGYLQSKRNYYRLVGASCGSNNPPLNPSHIQHMADRGAPHAG